MKGVSGTFDVDLPVAGDGRRIIYKVTDKGADLVPALLEIGAWGARHDAGTGLSQENQDIFARDREGVIARIKASIQKG